MDIKKKRIFILSPFFRPNIGGVENYLDDLCDYLRRKGYKLYVVTYQPLTTKIKGKSYEKEENLEVRRLPWFGYNWFHKLEPYPILEFFYLTPWLLVYSLFFMLKNSGEVDVIHAQGLNAAFIVKILVRIFAKRSVVSTCAVYNFHKRPLFSKIVKWTLYDFDKILPLADLSRQELAYIGIPQAKMDTYYLWVNQDRYIPRNKEIAKESINLGGRFLILFVGRLIKIKGVEILVEVAKTFDSRISFVFIVDSGPLLNYIEYASTCWDNIILVRGIHGYQLIPYYQAADILVVPSQYDEAFGKVVIEALSCGTPVIGANRGALPDIITTSVGRVVEPTVENIKSEIEYLYHHPESLSVVTKNCRVYAKERFSEKNAEVITKSYYS